MLPVDKQKDIRIINNRWAQVRQYYKTAFYYIQFASECPNYEQAVTWLENSFRCPRLCQNASGRSRVC